MDPNAVPPSSSSEPASADPASKEALRDRFREYRHSLSAADYAALSAAIVRRVADLPELKDAATVLAYWPLAERGEVDVRPLVDGLARRGVRVALPVVTGYARSAPRMEPRRFDGRDGLVPNRWGIPEPVDAERIAPDTLDVVLVPALGAGHNGHRVGHGAGYYDAFLDGLDGLTVGLVYHACLVDRVPAEPHDVPLDVIVSEHATTRPT